MSHHDAYVSAKNTAITVRLPLALKRRLERRASAERRSVSAQLLHDLEQLLPDDEPLAESAPSSVPALGRFRGAKVPGDADFREARDLLWGALGRRVRR
jgi:hypothetical protein